MTPETVRAAAPKSLTDRVFGGLFWQFTGTAGAGAMQIAFLTVLARLLTPSDFGIVGVALIVVGFSSLLAQLGVGPAMVFLPDVDSDLIRTGFTLGLALSLGAAGLVWSLSTPIATFFGLPELDGVLRLLPVVFVVRGASIVSEALLRRDLAFRRLAAIEFLSYCVGYGAVGTVLASLGYGYWALVWGHIGQACLFSVGLFASRPHSIVPLVRESAIRGLVKYGVGDTLFSFANYVATQGDNVLVGRLLGASALGLYGRAYQLLVTPARLFGAVLDRVLFPSMSLIQDQRERLARTFLIGQSAVALLALPASTLVWLLSPEVVSTLLGDLWIDVVAPLRIFSVALLFRTSYKISHSLVRATGRVYESAWRESLYALTVLVGAAVGSRWGISGVAAGTTVAIALEFTMFAALGMKITGLSRRDLLDAHQAGLRLAVVTTIIAYGLVTSLRALGAPPPITLAIVAGVLSYAIRNVLIRMWPHFFLGRDGLWVVRQAMASIPSVTRLIVHPKTLT